MDSSALKYDSNSSYNFDVSDFSFLSVTLSLIVTGRHTRLPWVPVNLQEDIKVHVLHRIQSAIPLCWILILNMK